jgi:hypothetical protein
MEIAVILESVPDPSSNASPFLLDAFPDFAHHVLQRSEALVMFLQI